MGLHERAAEIYSRPLTLAADDIPSTIDVEKAFDDAMEWLHGNRLFSSAMLTEEPVRNLIDKTTEYLMLGIERGIEEQRPSELMVNRLREDTGVFSGFKTFHEMKEAAGMLLDEKGNIKPFEHFSNDVQKVNKTYNKTYLRSEYDFTISSSRMAARWEELENDDSDRYLLQYCTAEDDKVRAEHAKLNGVTLAASDSFWDSYYPPNGWGCRCDVTKVLASRHPATSRKMAMEAGAEATKGKYSEMFRFNPGKQKTVFPAHNSYTIAKCSICSKNGLELAKIPSNELCAACPVIRKCAGDQAKSQAAIERTHYLREMEHLLKKKVVVKMNDKDSRVGFSKYGNRHLYSDTFGRSAVLKADHLKDLDKVLEAATYVRSEQLSKVRKDDIKRFHYLKSEVNGKVVYINIGEFHQLNSQGRIKVKNVVYSITDTIQK